MSVTNPFAAAADMLEGSFVKPWVCLRTECDGMPHDGFEYRHARTAQRMPKGSWWLWFIRAGRGWGKTRTGAEWLARNADLLPGSRWGMGAPTYDDGRDLMVEGESGLEAVCDMHQIRYNWNRSLGQFHFNNGAQADLFTSEKPESWRGPNLTGFWGDEPASWKNAKKCWDNLIFMVRKAITQMVFTGTPKNNAFTKLLREQASIETVGSSVDNRQNLSDVFWQKVIEPQLHTRLGRQEIHAQILDDIEGALWKVAQIEAGRLYVPHRFDRIVVAIDPSVSNKVDSDECGIVACGRNYDQGWVIEDRSLTDTPAGWASKALALYHDLEADLIVAEGNNGGDLVETVIHQLDSTVPVKMVNASRGKRTRAEPVAALYGDPNDPITWEQARIHHSVGAALEGLEDQMVQWVPDTGMPSPDRMDAAVWGFSELFNIQQQRRGRGGLQFSG